MAIDSLAQIYQGTITWHPIELNSLLTARCIATCHDLNFDRSPSGLILLTDSIFEHMIHLFKSSPISFWDKKEGPDQG